MICTTLPAWRPSVEVLACVDILLLECSSSIKALRRENRYGFKPDRLAHAARRRQRTHPWVLTMRVNIPILQLNLDPHFILPKHRESQCHKLIFTPTT